MAQEAPVNGVSTTLASPGITSTSQTTAPLTSATGFTNAQYHCLITDGTHYELVEATGLSGTTLTIVRAVEPWNGAATAYTFAAGATITVIISVASVLGVIASQMPWTLCPAPTGVAATDTANITAAITAVASTGGVVQLRSGTYAVTSAGRTDAGVTYNTGPATWSDTHCVSGDVGSYVLGLGINGRAPQILTVTAGVSFTTDIPPQGTVSAASMLIVLLAFVLPEGVTVQGMGAATLTGGAGWGSSQIETTKILDSGTGITCLIRGAAVNQSAKFGLKDMAIWGSSNSTMMGLFVSNNSWFLKCDNVDFCYHGICGAALDDNMNSDDFRDCLFLGNGKVGATGYTGGVLTSYFQNISSAAVCFYNCFFDQNYGWGIAAGSGVGAYGVTLYDCQFNVTHASAATGSGASAWLASGSGWGDSQIVGGWSESAALYDLVTNNTVTVIGFHLYSPTAYAWQINNGPCNAIGCWFANHTTASITGTGGWNISWVGCNVGDPYFYSGGPSTQLQYQGVGSSAGMFCDKAITGSGGGVAPGNFTGTTANAIWQGSGAPSTSGGAVADVWWRTDTPTTPLQQLYIKTASAVWTPAVLGPLASVIESELTTTNATAVATYTPSVAMNVNVNIYFRVVTATTNVTVTATWTDVTGAQTLSLLTTVAEPVGSYSLVGFMVNSVASSAIAVNVTAGTANQVYASVLMTEA
jgi:hypothetical protein